MAPHPAQIRLAERDRADRKADNQALLAWFAKHQPDLLMKLRDESLTAAAGHGLARPAEQVTADAWRHLIARLRFLDPRKKNDEAAS